MEIIQERLAKIKSDYALYYGISEHEASYAIDSAVIGVIAMAVQLKPIVDAAMQLWKVVKDSVQENHEKALWNTENEAMHGWNLDRDTRKRSQVMSNKPNFMVRKIIRG